MKLREFWGFLRWEKIRICLYVVGVIGYREISLKKRGGRIRGTLFFSRREGMRFGCSF